jgi:hypothetical protein
MRVIRQLPHRPRPIPSDGALPKPTVLRRVRRASRGPVSRLDRWVRLLLVANMVVIGFLAAAILYELITTQAGHPAQTALTAQSSPDLMEMGLAHIPTSSNCVLCHTSGGQGALKVVPAVLHPIEGWRRCVVCHTNETLGRKAPGHDGIAEEECLNCHKVAQAGPAITQPHAALHDQRCLECHGGVAHLPSSMASSREDQCILCHKPASLPPPSYPHAADARLSCRTCHQSAEVGQLPIDHALRSDSTCLLCHDIKRASPGSTPPPSGSGLLPRPSASTAGA